MRHARFGHGDHWLRGRRQRHAHGRRHQLGGRLRAHRQSGLRGRQDDGEELHRRTCRPRARPAQARSRASGEPRQALQDRAGRGLPDGLGVRERRGLGRRRVPDRVLRDDMPPLRHVLCRVLPQRAPGEPVHRHGARVHRDGRARVRAHRQHEERRHQARHRRQAGVACRLRRVHGLHRVQDQALQAAPPVHQGQGRAADRVREGQLPGGPQVLQRDRPERPGARMVRIAIRPLPQGGRLRPSRRACGEVHAGGIAGAAHDGAGHVPVPAAPHQLRRVRQLRRQALRRSVLVSRQNLPREPRWRMAPRVRRRPVARARRAPGHLGPQGQLLRGPVRRPPARRAADFAGHGDDRADRAAQGQAWLRQVRLRERLS